MNCKMRYTIRCTPEKNEFISIGFLWICYGMRKSPPLRQAKLCLQSSSGNQSNSPRLADTSAEAASLHRSWLALASRFAAEVFAPRINGPTLSFQAVSVASPDA